MLYHLTNKINDEVCDFLGKRMEKEIGTKGPWGTVKITKKELLDEFLPKFSNSKLFEDISLVEIEETIIRQAKFFIDGWNKDKGTYKSFGYKYKLVDNKNYEFIHITIDKWSNKHTENIDDLILWFDKIYFKDLTIIHDFTVLELKYADEWKEANSVLEKDPKLERNQLSVNPELLSPILYVSDYCFFKLLKMIQEKNGNLIVPHDYMFKSIFYEKIFIKRNKNDKKVLQNAKKVVHNIFLDKIHNFAKAFYENRFTDFKPNPSATSFEENNQLLLDQYENILKLYNKHFSVEGIFNID